MGDCRPGGGRRGAGAGPFGPGSAMIPVPAGVRVWLATGVTDMRRGMNTLALQVQEDLDRDPHAGDLYIFRDAEATSSRFSGVTGLGPRSMPSAWSAASSSGR